MHLVLDLGILDLMGRRACNLPLNPMEKGLERTVWALEFQDLQAKARQKGWRIRCKLIRTAPLEKSVLLPLGEWNQNL